MRLVIMKNYDNIFSQDVAINLFLYMVPEEKNNEVVGEDK